MQTVFITGDRSIPADVALGLVALTMLKETVTRAGEVVFATGLESGVEEAVRFVADRASITPLLVETPVDENGYKDFGQRALNASEISDTYFLILHADPHTSRITSQMLAVLDPDKVEIVHPSLV